MKIFTDKVVLNNQINGKNIFIDSDFLGSLYEHRVVLEEFITLLPASFFIIDPYIELEFRRGVFLPEQKVLKENFVSSPLFYPDIDQQKIDQKVKINALLLSQIYAQHNLHDASLVDLFLAARLISSYNAVIITGNRKHFPHIIFDTIAIMNIENNYGIAQPFYFIEFNESKFDKCYKLLKNLKTK